VYRILKYIFLIQSVFVFVRASIDLEARRQQAFDALEGSIFLNISKDHIVKEVMLAYRDENILKKHVMTMMDEAAYGDGVLHEIYSLFWDGFYRDFNGTDGHTEFAIPVIPSLSPQDYVAIGRMITHQFVQCATFPIRLAQASIQQLLVGDVEDECKINSFLQMLTPKEREILKNALACSGSFPTEQVMDVLEDYGGIRQVPSPKNIRSLVLDIATSSLSQSRSFAYSKSEKGWGSFGRRSHQQKSNPSTTSLHRHPNVSSILWF